MPILNKTVQLLLLAVVLLGFQGCSLLGLPFQLLGKIVDIASKAPLPPPWVFF